MKNVVLDTCSLVNLINADALAIIFDLANFNFYIGELVYFECCEIEEQKEIINNLIDSNKIVVLKNTISIFEFEEIKLKYSLGDGETESISIAKKIGYSIGTDDYKARKSAIEEVGRSQLCGSIFLLRELIQQGLITCEEGQAIQHLMKRCGGFLPKVDRNYLCR